MIDPINPEDIDTAREEANAEIETGMGFDLAGIWEDGFSMSLPTKMIISQDLSDGSFRFMAFLTTYCNRKNHEIWRKQETISKDYGAPIRTIRGYLHELSVSGLIEDVKFDGRKKRICLIWLKGRNNVKQPGEVKTSRVSESRRPLNKAMVQMNDSSESKGLVVTSPDVPSDPLFRFISEKCLIIQIPSKDCPRLREVWGGAFPGVDLPGEILKAEGWLTANKRRKTNYAKFLGNWFGRAMDRLPGTGGKVTTTQQSQDAIAQWLKDKAV